MENYKHLKITALCLLCATFICLLISQAVTLQRLQNIRFEDAARKEAEISAEMLDSLFSQADTLLLIILDHINSRQSWDEQEIEFLLKNRHFSPDGFYILRPGDKDVPMFMHDPKTGYKFTETIKSEKQQWIKDAAARNEPHWGGPVFDSGQKNRILYSCIPFSTTQKKKGAIIVLYNPDNIHQYFFQSGLSRFGMPYIMDSSTHFVVHPLDETRSLSRLAADYKDTVLARLCYDIINGKPLTDDYKHRNTVTGHESSEIVREIASTGWLLGTSVYDGISLETGEFHEYMRHGFIRMVIYLIVLALAVPPILKNLGILYIKRRIYLIYPALSILAIIAIVIIYNRYPQNDTTGRTDAKASEFYLGHNKWDPKRIIDQQGLDGFINDYQKESLILYDEHAKVIPTGLYLYNMEFLDSHKISVTGSLWQKYLLDGVSYPEYMENRYHYSSYMSKGIFFPGAHVSALEQTDSIPIMLDSYPAVLYRWNFDIEIEQELSYALYPFGKNEIKLPLWSNNLDDNTIMTPALESYRQIYPTDKPGLDNHFYIKGWDIYGSYYSYSQESYLCNFGNSDMYGVNLFPELIYNISISRKFIDILICKIIPLIVVLVLLFTILFVRMKDDGFNNIIGCSGLFFVLVLDHINLRETVMSEQIMYFEFFYFFTYILLLLITITSFDLKNNGRTYNLWVDSVLKKYFWSLIFGALTLMTIIFFY